MTSQRDHSRSTFRLQGKSQTFDAKSKDTVRTSRLNKIFNSRHLSPNPIDSSSSSQTRWLIDESYLDFAEFVELFKSFYFHCRRDLKDLFEKFASTSTIEKSLSKENSFANDSLDMSRHLTGLITRNILDDVTDSNLRRIYDTIAINSIPCYSFVTRPTTNIFISKDQFRDFLLEHQKEEKTSFEIDQIIFVR